MFMQFVIERAEVLSPKLKSAYLYFRGRQHLKTKYPYELMEILAASTIHSPFDFYPFTC